MRSIPQAIALSITSLKNERTEPNTANAFEQDSVGDMG